jgi:uncharacterized repeat protein (TIGR01451 family)
MNRRVFVPSVAAAVMAIAGGCETESQTRSSSTQSGTVSGSTTQKSSQPQKSDQARQQDGRSTSQGRVYGVSEMSFPTGDRDSSLVRVSTSSKQSQARVNQPFAYEVTVTNLSDDLSLEDVVIHQDLPPNVQIAGVRPEGMAEGGKAGEWRVGHLNPGETKKFEVAVVPQEAGRFDTCVRVSYNPVLCTSIDVVAPALRLTKDLPENVLVCDSIPVRYVVTNTGTGSTENVVIRDRLPEGITGPNNSNTVELNAGTLAQGQSREFTVNLRASRPGEFASEAIATAADGLEARADSRPTFISAPDLEIELRGPESEFTGKPIEYQVIVHNKGNAPAENTVLNLTVDPSAQLVRSTMPVKGGFANIDLGTIPPGQDKEAIFVFSMTRPGDVQFGATASARCSDKPEQRLATNIRGVSSLLLEVVDNNDPVRIGGEEIYQIMVVNQGAIADSNIQVVAEVPEQFEVISVKGPTQPQTEGNRLTFAPVQTLPPGQRIVWNVTVRARAAGDVRFKTQLQSATLTEPVIETEATRLY